MYLNISKRKLTHYLVNLV